MHGFLRVVAKGCSHVRPDLVEVRGQVALSGASASAHVFLCASDAGSPLRSADEIAPALKELLGGGDATLDVP